MKDFVVVFTKTNARILVNPPNMADLLNKKQAILNPSLDYVRACPPHFWKLEAGQIVPMDPKEQEERLHQINSFGVDNDVITEKLILGDPIPNFNLMLEDLRKQLIDADFEKIRLNEKIVGLQNEVKIEKMCNSENVQLNEELRNDYEVCLKYLRKTEKDLKKSKRALVVMSMTYCGILILLGAITWLA
jgi:hypothetical protein